MTRVAGTTGEAGTFRAGAGDARVFVRTRGRPGAPPVLLLHGWPQTGRAWDAVAEGLADWAFCLMPDLRGFGESAKPPAGYGMDRLAADLLAVLDAAGVERAVVVAHDLGGPPAWALAHAAPARVAALGFWETPFPGVPLPGVGSLALRFPHLAFHADVDLAAWLIAGRERTYLDQFIRRFAGEPDVAAAGLDLWAEALARPGALRASLEHYRALEENAGRGAELQRRPLDCPVVAWGAEHSMGDLCLAAARGIARSVTGGTVPGVGHWIPEERPAAIVDAVLDLFPHV